MSGQQATTQRLENDFHAVPLEEVLRRLSVDPERGLTNEEARHRLKQYGI
ncbi:MAG: cation-transporting P-type ATPase [Candidatus Thorarchaeota archaeon]